MSRRSKPQKAEIPPDVRFHSEDVQSFINRVMRRGKKSTAVRIVYDAFDLIEDRSKRNSVPMEVPPHRRFALATRWILQATNARSGKSFAEKLAGELMDAANNTGAAIRKREETHKMAEANRAFSHYRV
jgi:small subunit ribosomal protein S7